ncbi:hypothetical protein [Pseudomonas tohonis]|uniref:hypothetical protein n=1 Tax=Pseudomonas tohonis TaxID=2725477 RepID=UPI001F316738|nr:hypothetical protein [Pseudomonas tohonis]
MSKAQQVYDNTFKDYGNPRSDEYKAGCLYILHRKLDGTDRQLCPYSMPSAQADAWLAGCEYGLILAKNELTAGAAA